jgi:hypothetical protein
VEVLIVVLVAKVFLVGSIYVEIVVGGVAALWSLDALMFLWSLKNLSLGLVMD